MAMGPRLVSMNHQDEPLYWPPAAKPRARMEAFGETEMLVTCQPPAMRGAGPRFVQAPTPSVEASKVARQTSGPTPPRSQVMLERPLDKDCVAADVLSRRPRALRPVAARVEKKPPTRTL